jgi:hypothetical protein
VSHHLAVKSYAERERRGATAPAAPEAARPPALVTVAVDESAGSVAALKRAATEASLRGHPTMGDRGYIDTDVVTGDDALRLDRHGDHTKRHAMQYIGDRDK